RGRQQHACGGDVVHVLSPPRPFDHAPRLGVGPPPVALRCDTRCVTLVTHMEWRLFEGIAGEDVLAVLVLARRSTYRRGEVFFHHHDPADAVHLVVKGRFDVRITTTHGDVVALAIRGPGGAFRATPRLHGTERSATVSALEPGETLVLRG